MQQLIFTYGTLRRSQPNHGLLEGFDITVTAATARGIALFTAQHRGFPYAAEMTGGLVAGDLVTVAATDADAALTVLDGLEGYNAATETGHYLRRRCTVHSTAGTQQAWIYLAGRSARRHLTAASRICSGDWTRFDRNAR